jgi:hypothetical protein
VLKTEIESIKSSGSGSVSKMASSVEQRITSLRKNIEFALGDMLGPVKIEVADIKDNDEVEMHVSVDSGRNNVIINLDRNEVRSDADSDMDKQLKQVLTNVVTQLKNFS